MGCTNEMGPRSLAKVVGANASIRRDELGLTQEEVAERMRKTGLRWTRPGVTMLEAGKRDLGVGEFLLLAEVLSTSPSALLRAPENDEILIDGCLLPGELLGRLYQEAGMGTGLLAQIEQANFILRIDRDRDLAKRYGLKDRAKAILALHHAGETERRTAVRINRALRLSRSPDKVTGFEVSCAAVALWGHSLTDQRDQVAEKAGAKTAQARGHASRGLDDALAKKIARVRRLDIP